MPDSAVTAAISSTITQLAAKSGTPTLRELKPLTEVSQRDRGDFWQAWQALPAERRAELAQMMVELAEDNAELTLGEVWYWLLDDPDAGVRGSAIEGLWEDCSARVLRRMLELMRRDEQADVRAAAALALSRFAYLAAIDELEADPETLRQALRQAIANQHEIPEVRRRALESAGYFAEMDDIQEQVGQAYDSGDQLQRESALVAMGRSMLPRWLPTIARELSSQSPALRYEAARAAGEMADLAVKIMPALLPLVNDRDTEVALAAIWALGQIGGETAKTVLQRIKKSQDGARSQAAADALDELALGDSLV